MSVYCTSIFVGQRIPDCSISNALVQTQSLRFTLSFTPTKRYPSAFGAGLYEDNPNSSSSTIIHGTYSGTSHDVFLTEVVDTVPTYEYACKLSVDRTSGNVYLHGTWKSLDTSNIFGKFVMISEKDSDSSCISGIWVGEARPAPELHDFLIPVNPIRWCITLFRKNDHNWRLFGSGYFDDSADIPNQPLLFFSLDGSGTFDNMTVVKKYAALDYSVDYTLRVSKSEIDTYILTGDWSNSQANSYGSFEAEQCRLDPMITHRLDICLCVICNNVIHPGENRWHCTLCHFSTCPGCNLNELATNHPHKLTPHILPTQKLARGSTSVELINSAFKNFELSPFIGFRSRENKQITWLTYGDVSWRCYALAKYCKQFLLNTNSSTRPCAMLIADTSPAYITCLLAGLLSQSVVFPINGNLQADALKHVLSISDPSILIVGEKYFEKVSNVLPSKSNKLILTISETEEQFQSTTTMSISNDSTSLSTAIELGNQLDHNILSSPSLSHDSISAILPTSGSTGYPKGTIFTEELLVPTDTFTLISPFIRIDYQPFDPALVPSLLSTIQYGSSRGLTNLTDMWDDIRELKPTSLGLSPAIWTSLYKRYLRKLTGFVTDQQREEAAREMRQSLGGRVVVGTSGGGSISPSVLSFIRNSLKIDVVDMYGCRECGNISRNGVLYPAVDVKLIPVPELGLDGETEGEICVHSPKMISGYLGIDKHSVFIDIDGKQFYRTGDIGSLNQRTLKLFDRSGTMIKNALAEWIAPVKIENILEQLVEISAAFVVGDSACVYVAVIVCPSETGRAMNESEMLQLIRFYGAHCGLRGGEIPQNVYIERDITWNETNGLMKEKKCRAALLKHYSQVKHKLFHEDSVHLDIKKCDLSSEFVSMLENILGRSLNGQINGQNTFLEVGADSLAVAHLCKIFHEHSIPLEPSTVYNQQLDHLEEIFSKKRIVHDEIILDIDWRKECELPDRIQNLLQRASNLRKTNILVTGSTGFLGPLIVSEIINKTDSSILIYCLIRANSVEQAQLRLELDMKKCQRFSSINWSRIRCINGDISKENLGLTQDFYNELTEQIGLVYHNASIVNLQVPYKALKAANIQGTLNCLEFAVKSHARLVYTSSTAALPATVHLKEDSNGWVTLTPNDINLKDGYGQTKVVAEQLLLRASNLGADVVIVRPCTISGDTQTGYSNLLDFVSLLLLAEVEMGCMVENADIQLHPVPVDFCAKAIVALGMHSDSRGRCFNFFGNDLSISYFHDAIIQRLPGVIKKKLKQNEWKHYVLNNLSEKSSASRMNETIASMVFVSEHSQQKQSGVQIETTKQFLKEKCNLNWFEVTQADAIKSVEYMANVGFLSGRLSS